MNKDQSQKVKSLTQDRFGRYAEGYVTSQTFAAGAELKLLREMAEPQPDWIVLDVATGGGHTAMAFLPYVRRVIASDLTMRMLVSARQHARQVLEAYRLESARDLSLEFHQVDAESLPYARASFDLVTCRIAPHHFPDAALFVKESARILRSGGRLVVQDHLLPEDVETSDYLNAFERLRDPSHQRGFSRREWEAMYGQAGLKIGRVETIRKKHAFLPFAERQGCSPEVIAELAAMLRDAPPGVRTWREPVGFEGDLREAVFSDQHILIAGGKE